MSYILSTLVAAVVSGASFLGLHFLVPQPVAVDPHIQETINQYVQKSLEDNAVFGSTLPIAGNTYNLAGSGVTGSASSITLQSLTIKQTGQKIVDSDMSDTFYLTLEPGNNSRQEIVSCTTVVQNANSTATLSGCSRGLSPITPYTASTTLQFSHAGGTQVIFSDPPQHFNLYGALANANTWTGVQTFTAGANPTYSSNPASFAPNDLVNYSTLLSTAISGAGTSSYSSMGISQLATRTQLSLSTASSSEGRPLILSNNFATTTCQATGSNALVASSTTGKLDGRCLDTTSNEYSWTKLQSFTGTTSISASNINTNPLKLNTLAYTFQSSRAASSTILSEDGAGNLTWEPVDWQLLVSTTTTAAMNTATTTITGTPAELRVVFYTPSVISGTSKYFITINGDAAANYGVTATALGGGMSSYMLSGQGGIDLSDNGSSTTSPAHAELRIRNISTLAKVIQFTTSLYSGGTLAPALITGAAQWNNTSSVISSIQFKLSGANTMPIGTVIRVYGSGR